MIRPFPQPIYITRPILPDLELFLAKIREIWKSKILSNHGTQTQLLEEKLRELLKVKHLCLFNNGTTALLIGLKSLNLRGEVITTPFTFPATPHCLTWNNLTPVFCDISPTTLNIDTDKIESLITPRTSAILAVHVFGIPCEVTKIANIAKKHHLKVIYDGAHAFGTEFNNQPIGRYGDMTMFSFHPTKLFHTAEGGALVFNDSYLQGRLQLLRNFGIKKEDEVFTAGINGKINEISSALGLLVMDHIRKERSKRKHLEEIYRKNLSLIPGVSIIDHDTCTSHSYQYFVVRINAANFGHTRDYVYAELKKYNIFARKYFYPLCSDFPHYKHLKSSAISNLPCAHQAVTEVLSLPFYGKLRPNDVSKICKILLEIHNHEK